jgi:membrane-bound lytic murein transglycosylase B
MMIFDSRIQFSRRSALQCLGAAAALAPFPALAAMPQGFEQWRDKFRARALSKGISSATWSRCMDRIEPAMRVFQQLRSQPEFHEKTW